MVPGIVPDSYSVDFHPGRTQPFTVRYDRPVTNQKQKTRVVSEVFAFCSTWVEALRRVRDDHPDADA